MIEQDLKKLLSEGIVEFTFIKANGEQRKAKGSRNIELLEAIESSGFTSLDIPKGTGKENNDICSYWDFDKKAWRCAKINSVISIENIITKEQFGV